MARPNRGSGTRAFGGLVIERETGRARTRHPREQRGAGAAQRRQDVADDRRNRPRGRFEIVAALHRAFEKFAFGNRAAIIAVPPREDGGGRNRHARIDEQHRRTRQTINWGELLTPAGAERSEEHTSELQSLMRTSSAVFCLK